MKKQHVQLTATDQDYLETLISKGELKARSYRRALGLLELDCGKTYTVVAETLALPCLRFLFGQPNTDEAGVLGNWIVVFWRGWNRS